MGDGEESFIGNSGNDEGNKRREKEMNILEVRGDLQRCRVKENFM